MVSNFDKLNRVLAVIFLLIALIVTVSLIRSEKRKEEISVQFQAAEVERQIYKEEVERLRVENHILYDNIRQIEATNEMERATSR